MDECVCINCFHHRHYWRLICETPRFGTHTGWYYWYKIPHVDAQRAPACARIIWKCLFISCLRRSSICCCCFFSRRRRSRMVLQLGMGQSRSLQCDAWIRKSVHIRLQILHPPEALILHWWRSQIGCWQKTDAESSKIGWLHSHHASIANKKQWLNRQWKQ